VRWRLRGYPHWAAYRRIPQEIEAEWIARRNVLGGSAGVDGEAGGRHAAVTRDR
jgi:hypothetical protein